MTGAGAGVGQATAEKLAGAGASVFVADIDCDAGRRVAAGIEAAGGRAIFVPVDQSDPVSVARLFEQVEASGRLDVAINNAAIDLEIGALTGSWDLAVMERVYGVNIRGTFDCLRRELAIMGAQGGGAIVNVASTAGLVGVGGKPAYTASKHAVVGLTRAAAVQFGPLGVRVNAVCPSAVRTGMLEIQGIDEERLISAHPLGRIADADDVAEAIMWLCSDQARHVTGHPMAIDGGRLAY